MCVFVATLSFLIVVSTLPLSLYLSISLYVSYWVSLCIIQATNDTYVDRTAAFGPRIPEEGLVLDLIAIEKLDINGETTACNPVTGPSWALNNTTPWAALVERGGDCSFVEKVRNMQASGAMAVVVGDNQHNGLITMFASGK